MKSSSQRAFGGRPNPCSNATRALKRSFWPSLSASKNNPFGDAIGKGCYKIRVAIASKGQGKRGGARLITCVRIEGQTVYALTVYDKSDQADLAPGELEMLLAQAELL